MIVIKDDDSCSKTWKYYTKAAGQEREQMGMTMIGCLLRTCIEGLNMFLSFTVHCYKMCLKWVVCDYVLCM